MLYCRNKSICSLIDVIARGVDAAQRVDVPDARPPQGQASDAADKDGYTFQFVKTAVCTAELPDVDSVEQLLTESKLRGILQGTILRRLLPWLTHFW